MAKVKLTAQNLLYQICASICQFIIMVSVARSISIADNGIYVMGVLISNTLTNIMVLGLNSANIYFVNLNIISAKQALYSNMKYWIFVIVFLGPFLFGIYLCFGRLFFPGISFEIYFCSMLLFIFTLAKTLMLSIFQAISRFDLFNKYFILNVFVQLILILGLITLNSITPINALVAMSFTTLALVVIIFTHMFKLLECKSFLHRDLSKSILKMFFSYGLKSHLSNVVAFMMSRTDVYMLNYFINPSASAIYMVAILFVERIGMVSQSLATILFPEIASLNSDKNKQYLLICQAFRLNMVITFVLSVAASSLIYPAVLYIFGKEYLSSVTIFIILVAGVFLKSGSRILSISISALGRPEINFYTALFAIITNIILNLLFIPNYGICGAAYATSISFCVNFIIRIWVMQSSIFGVPLKLMFPKKDDLVSIYKYIFQIRAKLIG
ncbi:polysaccharide biosynthesis C-terminal domain-containing protein [Thermodesulfobacteriota bacterium]